MTQIPETDWVYDIETYADLFCVDLTHVATRQRYIYEVSDRWDMSAHLFRDLYRLGAMGHRVFGFNNLGFDWPVLQHLISIGSITAWAAHTKGTNIITSNDRFGHTVWPSDRTVIQGDLFKIHHFDNISRSTSLKKLQINMRLQKVLDLPYPPDQPTTHEQKEEIVKYMCHDVSSTLQFYLESLDQIRFRDELAAKYPDMGDVLNMNDTAIGKKFFARELERNGTPCYHWPAGRKEPRQTHHDHIDVRDLISQRVEFSHPEFARIKAWLESQRLVRGADGLIETKGIFKDVSATIDGFTYDFGTGGIHGSVERTVVHEDDEWEIWDWDVASYYPNLAISNRFFPRHLSEQFCEVYQEVYEMRQQHAKGTAENAMLKLALNGVYGDSNSKFSPFYDPAYTMSITINGQLMLCMLAEWLRCDGVRMIQINTDGLTVRVRKTAADWMRKVCEAWESKTGLQLESVQYRSMFVRDVNNYVAVKKDGSLKQIGAYKTKRGWHQDQSNMASVKAAIAQMVDGVSVEETIMANRDPFDFQCSIKVPRSSRLETSEGAVIQNNTRYYLSTDGVALTKVMPPLKGKTEERRLSVEAGWTVTVTNDMSAFRWDNVNYYYYINKAKELVV